jgi:hypothetical protein
MRFLMRSIGGFALMLAAGCALAQGTVGAEGGKAVADGAAGSIVLGNHKIAARLSQSEQGLRVEFKGVLENKAFQVDPPFSILFRDGTITSERAAAFGAVAFKKINEELIRKRSSDD